MAVKATTSSNQTRSASYAEEVGEKKERVRGKEKEQAEGEKSSSGSKERREEERALAGRIEDEDVKVIVKEFGRESEVRVADVDNE
ncbi:hypothetical protein H109_04401 [Trichophyton interdigitale MR816]|uniref:Uncharacterized protein n=1 Tax=Trichophyton interdigitale (strain MR816) TaxID=1215338 RepID=A0A059J787_TRIIM|nr:hypothetical protein H109_04401 [Trichophyton interdigitale MR816]